MNEQNRLCRSQRDITKCNSIMFAQINATDRHLFRTPGEQTIFEGKMVDVQCGMIRHYYRRMDASTKARAKKILKHIVNKQTLSLKL